MPGLLFSIQFLCNNWMNTIEETSNFPANLCEVMVQDQCIMDLVVAGISLVIGFGIFAFIASILCSAAFLYNAKEVS
ncbi:hypothetical protein Q3G72_006093 [Acer saccharum]|nr:hypothetical protein Q3G72_006093 [Acer saccharum]